MALEVLEGPSRIKGRHKSPWMSPCPPDSRCSEILAEIDNGQRQYIRAVNSEDLTVDVNLFGGDDER